MKATSPHSSNRFPSGRGFPILFRVFSILMAFVLAAATLSSAGAASDFLVLMMSRNADAGEGDGQSDYASIAFGSMSMVDPFPPMVFSSDATNLLDANSAQAAGMVESPRQYDVFLHDEVNNETRLLSRTNSATGSDGESVLVSVGVADPNLAVFQSSATNLSSITPDANAKTDIYMIDMNDADNEPVLVSGRNAMGVGGNNHSGNTLDNGATWKLEGGVYTQISDWHKPAFVYTGYVDNTKRTLVLFESRATNLTSLTTNGKKQIFKRDVYEQITTHISRNSFGEQVNDDAWQPSASTVDTEEGRYIVFVSDATNLVDMDGDGDIDAGDCLEIADVTGDGVPDDSDLTNPYDVNQDGKIDAKDDTKRASNIYMIDTMFNTVTLISRRWNCAGGACTPGEQANGPSSFPSFSQDGRYIAFQSKASNLVEGDENGYTDIFLYDTQNNDQRLRIISVSSNIPPESGTGDDLPGVQGNLPSYSPVVVSNGPFSAQIAVFTSYATNLIDGDANENCLFPGGIEGAMTRNCPDVYVHDFNRGQTWRVSLAADGLESQTSAGWPTLSGNGRFVYFTSNARLLGEGNYTGRRQVYLRDQGNPPGNPNLQPTSWTFPAVLAGSAEYPTRRFRISALAHITILNVRMEAGTDYTLIEDDCSNFGAGRELNDGDECTFVVQFNPVHSGRIIDRVLIDLHDTNPGMRDRTISSRVSGTSTYFFYAPLITGNP